VKRIITALGIAALVLLAAACTKSGTHSAVASGKAQVKASASALATSPALLKDERVALARMQHCTASATSGELAWTADTSDPQHPQFQVTHWSLALLHHPIVKFHGIITCAAPKGSGQVAWACVRQLPLPTSRQAVGNWMVGGAKCIVALPQ
jgi:hypothetical protein